MTDLKLPPHSVEAEQSVIGGLMLDNSAWDTIADRVGADDFYRADHRLIFRVIVSLAAADKPLDVVTVSESLAQDESLGDAGGLSYLARLAKDTPSAANIRAYADIVRERALRRQLIQLSGELAGEAYAGTDAAELLDSAQTRLHGLLESRQQSGWKSESDVLRACVEELDDRYHAGGGLIGASTGFVALDEITLGLEPGTVTVIAGRPSMGKSALASDIASTVAGSKSVAIWSGEMPAKQLVYRRIAKLARVQLQRIRSAKLQEDDWTRIAKATAAIGAQQVFIDDTPGLSIADFKVRVRRLHRRNPLGVVVVDYLQLMSCPGEQNRERQIAEISKGCKHIALELNIPVLLLSQLNRMVETRADKRPRMSDLRESGAVEQDADVIVFLYRDEVYDKHTRSRGVAEVIVAKQRNGPIDTVYLQFDGGTATFRNLIPGYVPPARSSAPARGMPDDERGTA